MFSSISKTIPQTQTSTSFTANRTMTIVPVTPFSITVNGQVPVDVNSVTVAAGDRVTATVTTPDDWLWYTFYYYQIDGVPQTFAVVSKSKYTIQVKPADIIKRWYVYNPTNYIQTYRSVAGTNSNLLLGNNYELLGESYHVVLNPLDNGVYFYGADGIQLSKVVLPAAPLDYVKVTEKQSLVVLVFGGESYEIFLNNTVAGIAPFYARRNYSEFTDLGYVKQLPGEDLISYLRRARVKKAIPPATCLTYNGIFVIAGGNGSVWVVDPMANFTMIGNFSIDEFVLNIVSLPDNTGVLLVTQSQKIYVMDMNGNFEQIYQGTALWQPALFNGKVYIPEGNIGLLKVYNPTTALFEADIGLPEFSPSYTFVEDQKLYVCGHDSERVLVFDSNMAYSELYFGEKVTLVSVVGGTVVASHWLKDFKILDLQDLRRIVQVEFKERVGPVSHVATTVVTVRTLGNPEVTARTPNSSFLWANGQRTYSNENRGTVLQDGDIISLNHAIRTPGLTRTNCIIGDMAYDYDVNAVAQTYYPRNIDIGIVPPGDSGIHVRVITLPPSFVPCLMSVEYGTIKVNEAYYYGNFLVGSNDVIKIEIDTRQNSALPVLTIGRRQFVIPVSYNPGTIEPVVLLDDELEPSTRLIKQIDFGELPSLFDYIIPGYYDITIKKNSLDITGNYYQQFGKNDQLIVEYSSSYKLFDTTDVYILGSTNYRFTAKNKLGRPINYLDYGNILLPYTRRFEFHDLSNSVNIGAPYNLVQQFATPEIQYITANLTVAGLATGVDANLSVTGGDSYFVVNGTITSDINVIVGNGDQIGLARNVISYHDVPVQVIQHLPTGDEDGWADVPVGIWNIVNRTVDEPETTEVKNLHDLAETSAGTLDISRSIMVIESLAKLNKHPIRNLQVYKQQLDFVSALDAQQSALAIDRNNIADAAQSAIVPDATFVGLSNAQTGKLLRSNGRAINAAQQQLDPATAFQIDKMQLKMYAAIPLVSEAADTTLVNSNVLLDFASVVQRSGPLVRALNFATLRLNLAYSKSIDGYRIVFDKLVPSKAAAGILSIDTSSRIAVPGSLSSWAAQANGTVGIYKLNKFALNIRAVVTSREQLTQFDPLVMVNLKFVSTVPTTQVPDVATQSKFDGTAVMVASTNGIKRYQNRKMIVPSIPEQLNINKATNEVFMPKPVKNRVESTVSDVADVAAQGSSTAATNFITALIATVNSWIDKDISWQGFDHSDSVIDLAVPTYKSAGQLIELPSRPRQRSAETAMIGPMNPTAVQNYQGEWDLLIVNDGRLGVSIGAAIPHTILQTTDVSGLKIQPYSQGTINFSSSITVAGTINYNYANGRTLVIGSQRYYTFFPTQVDTESHSYTTDLVRQQINPAAETRSAKQGMYKFQLAEPDRQQIDAAPNLRNFQFQSARYQSAIPGLGSTSRSKFFNQRMTEFRTVNTIPGPSESINLITGFTPSEKIVTNLSPARIEYQSQTDNLLPVVAVYSKAGTADTVAVPMNYTTDRPFDNNVVMQYARYDALPVTMVIPSWSAADYGLDAFVGYRLQHQQQNELAESRMTLAREIPNHYFTAITVPELDNGVLWYQDVDVEYGAFTTERDAIYAARNYAEFRPYLIMDTDMWSYRVILDTGLVCRLPKGRYPIAWLLRGG